MKKINEFITKQKLVFLQSLANIILERMEKATTKTDVQLWFDFGMKLNMWCTFRDIYLD